MTSMSGQKIMHAVHKMAPAKSKLSGSLPFSISTMYIDICEMCGYMAFCMNAALRMEQEEKQICITITKLCFVDLFDLFIDIHILQ